MDIDTIIPVLMIVGAFCAMLAIVYYNVKKKQKLKVLATDINLDYSEYSIYSLPKIDGNYRNHHVEISVILKQREEMFDDEHFGEHFTVIRVFYNKPTRLNMSVSPVGLLGAPDILFDDDAFNKNYRVSGNDYDTIKQILNEDIRQKMMAIKNFKFYTNDTEAKFERSGWMKDKTRIRYILNLMVEIVQQTEKIT